MKIVRHESIQCVYITILNVHLRCIHNWPDPYSVFPPRESQNAAGSEPSVTLTGSRPGDTLLDRLSASWRSSPLQPWWPITVVHSMSMCYGQCHTHLAIPDVCSIWSLKNKAVVGVETRGLFFNLNCTCVKLIGTSYMEQTCSIYIIAVCIKPVLERTSATTRVDHHTPLEHQ